MTGGEGGSAMVASVYMCEKGCRVYSIWSTPSVCRVMLDRRTECGLPLYPVDELPEQVQRALNPLKASKRKGAG